MNDINHGTKNKLWAFKELLKIVFFYLVISLAASIMIHLLKLPMWVALDAVDILSSVYVVWLLRHDDTAELKERINFRNFSISGAVALTLAGFVFAEIINFIDGIILSGFISVEPNETAVSENVLLPTVVLLGPVCEELLFRFGMTELLREHFRPWFVILSVTALFAVSHSYNIQGVLNVFFSLLPAILVCFYTKNLLYSIFSHILHNAMCYIPFGDMRIMGKALYYEKNGFEIPSVYYLIICIAVCMICTAWSVRVFMPKTKSE